MEGVVGTIMKKNILLFAILSVGLVFLLGVKSTFSKENTSSSTEEIVQDLKQSATSFFEEKEYGKALKEAFKIQKIQPQAVEIYEIQTKAYYFLKKYKKSLESFQHAKALFSKNSENYLYQGLSYFKMKDYQNSISALSRYLAGHYSNIEGSFARGVAYLQLNNSVQAMQDFKKVLSLNPQNSEFQFYAGKGYYLLQSYMMSIPLLLKFVNSDPKNSFSKEAYFMLGRGYEVVRNYKEALKNYTIAHKKGFKDKNFNLYLGNVFTNLEDYKKAISYYSKALKTSDKKTVYQKRAFVYKKIGQDKKASQDTEKIKDL